MQFLSKTFDLYKKERGQRYAEQQQQHRTCKSELTGITTLLYPTSYLAY
jgi:hypothetical protein